MNLDRTDARILTALQEDGRLSVVQLAERIGLSPTPCARRIRLMEEAGLIEGYAAVVNPSQLGLKVQAYIQVKLQQHSDETVAHFEQELENLDEVISCVATTGESDFLLHVVASDLDSLGTVVLKKLLKIPGVRDLRSSIVLDTVKRSARLPMNHLTARA